MQKEKILPPSELEEYKDELEELGFSNDEAWNMCIENGIEFKLLIACCKIMEKIKWLS